VLLGLEIFVSSRKRKLMKGCEQYDNSFIGLIVYLDYFKF
jgi:hypothetical protein